MCGTNDILQGRDSAYVFKTLVKAIELASTKGQVYYWFRNANRQ